MISPGEICSVRFSFAYASIPLRPAVVKAVRLESSVRIISQHCNLKIYNALRRNFRERNRLRLLPGLENREIWAPGLVRTSFCYNQLSSQFTRVALSSRG
jgi:hypothetical protein